MVRGPTDSFQVKMMPARQMMTPSGKNVYPERAGRWTAESKVYFQVEVVPIQWRNIPGWSNGVAKSYSHLLEASAVVESTHARNIYFMIVPTNGVVSRSSVCYGYRRRVQFHRVAWVISEWY